MEKEMNIIGEYYSDTSKIKQSEQKDRFACRGILRDTENKIATLFKDNIYYSLPGGGVEDNEAIGKAFVRECFEETGCVIEETKPIGITIEHFSNGRNITYIFNSIIIGEKGPINFVGDEDEDEARCVLEWINKEELLNTISNELNEADDNRKFRYKRDLDIINFCLDSN